jgi:signal transduction histidine kinase
MTATAPARAETHRARGWFALQLAIGWLPVFALFAASMYVVHRIPVTLALAVAARTIIGAALLSVVVLRFIKRTPWPRPVRPGFVLLHVAAAGGYAVGWVVISNIVESIARGAVVLTSPGLLAPFLLLGLWLYVAVAGVSYAVQATARAAQAEAVAVRVQLAALRGQLNPHFLFNALHSVVHLIPVAPELAAESVERLAGLLRTVLEENRDRVTLRDERAFVARYVELEQLRFGERLVVQWDIPDRVSELLVPAFALQTLVENAVRHGAASRVDPTKITLSAHHDGTTLALVVADDGAGANLSDNQDRGTGLRRLREQLDALYGSQAALTCESRPGNGFTARVTVPVDEGDDVE